MHVTLLFPCLCMCVQTRIMALSESDMSCHVMRIMEKSKKSHGIVMKLKEDFLAKRSLYIKK